MDQNKDDTVPAKAAAEGKGCIQIVAGWWRHQPGQRAVGGVPTAHKQPGYATMWDAPEGKRAILNLVS